MKNYSSTTVTIRNCMAVFTTLLLFCAVSSLQAQWKQCNGLYGGNISGLFTVGNTLYAQENGLFKSTISVIDHVVHLSVLLKRQFS